MISGRAHHTHQLPACQSNFYHFNCRVTPCHGLSHILSRSSCIMGPVNLSGEAYNGSTSALIQRQDAAAPGQKYSNHCRRSRRQPRPSGSGSQGAGSPPGYGLLWHGRSATRSRSARPSRVMGPLHGISDYWPPPWANGRTRHSTSKTPWR